MPALKVHTCERPRPTACFRGLRTSSLPLTNRGPGETVSFPSDDLAAVGGDNRGLSTRATSRSMSSLAP